MKRVLIYLLIFLSLVSGALYVSDPHFWQRYIGLMKAKFMEQSRGQWYSPLAEVASLKGAPLAVRSESELAQQRSFKQALDEAEAYIEDRSTSSFLVWHDGQVVRERYFGETSQDSLILSKSMAKPLASLAVARALQQGHINSLDQTASDYIQEWRGTEKEKITIRHILNMASGLERFYRTTSNPFANFHRGFLSGKHEDIIINDVPLQDPPGSHYDYSQITSDLVAVLIERATNSNYQDYIAEQLLQPIGAAGGTIWLNREDGVAHSGCCIMLPGDTWLRLGVLMVQDGVWEGERILPEWWNREVLKASSTNPNHGLYFWLGSPHQSRRYLVDPKQAANPGIYQSEPYAADDVIMFDGNGNQVIYIVPSKMLVAVRTGNWAGKDTQGNEWDNTFIPNLLIRALDDDAKTVDSVADKPPPFSSAMQTYKPLGIVKGDLKPLFNETPPVTEGKLAAALQYAQDMDSYAFLVWHRGRLIAEEYYKGFDKNVRPETASMHKSVLALLVAAAVEDGFIKNLNEPIGNYINEWRNSPEGKITINNLLTMSSGLKPLSSQGGANSPRFRFSVIGENARQTLLAMRLEAEPGSRFLYANTNSQLLGLVLEAATKMPYAQYLSERLWQPIGADDAYVWYNDADTLSFPRTHSALLARPRDWLRLGLMIKNRGTVDGRVILNAASVDNLTESSLHNPNYAKHIWLGVNYNGGKRFYNSEKQGVSIASSAPFHAKDMIYFDGFGGQRVYVSREHDLVVVRVGDIRFDWDDTYLPNLVINSLRSS